MKTKICYFTSKDDNDIRVFHKECVSLANAGFDVSLVCPNAKDRIQNNVKIYGIDYNGKNDYSRFFQLPKKLYEKALSIDADIYHFNDPASIPYAIKLKSLGKKVIFDAFEDHPSMWINRGSGIKKIFYKCVGWTYKQYENKQAKKFDGIFTCYHWTKERLSKVNNNVELVLNFPIINEYEPISKQLKSLDEIYVCYAGTISRDWNIPRVIDAIAMVDQASFNLAGWADDDLMKSMKSQNGWTKVRFFGKLPKLKVYSEIYNTSDIGIALYHYSPLCHGKIGNLSNNKLFEYMLMGLPVICTDFELWKEVVEGNKCGICVSPQDTQAIANAILYLKNNPSEVLQMGINGQKAVLEKYNWNSQEAILLKLYEKIGNKKDE